MTKAALMIIQSALARTACAQRTGHDLEVLRANVERTSVLPPGVDWEHKAAAHAEFDCLLADATGNPVFAILARCISSSLQDMIVAAGPEAEDRILASRRRLLARLAARDADGAAREVEDCLPGLGGADSEPQPASPGNYRTVAAPAIRPRLAPAPSGMPATRRNAERRAHVKGHEGSDTAAGRSPVRSWLAGGQDSC